MCFFTACWGRSVSQPLADGYFLSPLRSERSAEPCVLGTKCWLLRVGNKRANDIARAITTRYSGCVHLLFTNFHTSKNTCSLGAESCIRPSRTLSSYMYQNFVLVGGLGCAPLFPKIKIFGNPIHLPRNVAASVVHR